MPERVNTSNACTTTETGDMPSICFGYVTALQILRAAKQGELSMPKERTRPLPDRAPTARELRRRLERLESSHPDIAFKEPVHVLVGSPNCRASETCKPHVCAKPFSNDSLLRLERETLITAPELSLIHMATQENDWISLLQLGWEACGSYQTKRSGSRSAYQVAPLTNVRALSAYVSKRSSTKGARKIARLLPYLADGSASPHETKLALILGLPMLHGGYGLGIPCMNYEVSANRAARAISGRKSFRCDLCWPEAKLDVEYQSRESHEGEASASATREGRMRSLQWDGRSYASPTTNWIA